MVRSSVRKMHQHSARCNLTVFNWPDDRNVRVGPRGDRVFSGSRARPRLPGHPACSPPRSQPSIGRSADGCQGETCGRRVRRTPGAAYRQGTAMKKSFVARNGRTLVVDSIRRVPAEIADVRAYVVLATFVRRGAPRPGLGLVAAGGLVGDRDSQMEAQGGRGRAPRVVEALNPGRLSLLLQLGETLIRAMCWRPYEDVAPHRTVGPSAKGIA